MQTSWQNHKPEQYNCHQSYYSSTTLLRDITYIAAFNLLFPANLGKLSHHYWYSYPCCRNLCNITITIWSWCTSCFLNCFWYFNIIITASNLLFPGNLGKPSSCFGYSYPCSRNLCNIAITIWSLCTAKSNYKFLDNRQYWGLQ